MAEPVEARLTVGKVEVNGMLGGSIGFELVELAVEQVGEFGVVGIGQRHLVFEAGYTYDIRNQRIGYELWRYEAPLGNLLALESQIVAIGSGHDAVVLLAPLGGRW